MPASVRAGRPKEAVEGITRIMSSSIYKTMIEAAAVFPAIRHSWKTTVREAVASVHSFRRPQRPRSSLIQLWWPLLAKMRTCDVQLGQPMLINAPLIGILWAKSVRRRAISAIVTTSTASEAAVLLLLQPPLLLIACVSHWLPYLPQSWSILPWNEKKFYIAFIPSIFTA